MSLGPGAGRDASLRGRDAAKCWGGRPPTASIVPGCDCAIQQGSRPMRIIRIGLDTAKHVFQVHGVDETKTAVVRALLRRGALAKFFAKLPPSRIGLEACGASHHWARLLRGLGHEVVLLPPQYIQAHIQRGKNDAIDPAAICEA